LRLPIRYYYESSPNLGLKITPPELPRRKLGQAKVQCDEAGANFCRLYDEWGHDHLIAYRKRMGMTRGLPIPTLGERFAAQEKEKQRLLDEAGGMHDDEASKEHAAEGGVDAKSAPKRKRKKAKKSSKQL
jgi:hypothetical protein